MKTVKVIKKKEFLFIMLLSIAITSPIFAYQNYLDSKYIYIRPIIAAKDIRTGERFTTDSILVGRDERVLKEDINNYLTGENYQTILSENSYFTKDIKYEKRLKFQDFCQQEDIMTKNNIMPIK